MTRFPGVPRKVRMYMAPFAASGPYFTLSTMSETYVTDSTSSGFSCISVKSSIVTSSTMTTGVKPLPFIPIAEDENLTPILPVFLKSIGVFVIA